MPTAKINLTVTQFADINTTTNTPRWTVAAAPVITDSANGKVRISADDPNRIVVKGPSRIDLEFTILPAGQFSPAGIAYTQATGTGDRNGKSNFDLGALTSSTITITNKLKDSGSGANAPRWKFFVLVQDQSGALGIIDPEIENEMT